MNDPVIVSIAKKHQATSAQVLLKWGLVQGHAVIVKSSSESRMKENLACLRIPLDDYDMDKIKNIGEKCRYFTYKSSCFGDHTPEEFFDDDYYN